MKWENSLMAYEDDIRDRSFWDWMKAHTSGFEPLHRYEGVLGLNEERIIFDGRDVKEAKDFDVEIPLKDVTDVYFGWDDVFTGFPLTKAGERAYPWNKPLRLRYRDGQEERTLYVFAHFHHARAIRASDNEEAYEKLKAFVKS
jgi:hypothetical protein